MVAYFTVCVYVALPDSVDETEKEMLAWTDGGRVGLVDKILFYRC